MVTTTGYSVVNPNIYPLMTPYNNYSVVSPAAIPVVTPYYYGPRFIRIR
jgi:hypothetical protein